MRLHYLLDTHAGPYDRPIPTREEVSAFIDQLYREIELAEAGGFDAIVVPERHGRTECFFPSSLVLLSVIAARTSRIRLGSYILVLPLHHPIHVAEQVAMIDQVSRGRVIFGVAAGYHSGYSRMFGIPHHERGARFEEQVEIIKLAWTEERFSYHGRYYHFDEVRLTPKPYQQPMPEWWVGGMFPKTIARAGRIGDAWCSDPFPLDRQVWLEQVRLYREAARAAVRALRPTFRATDYARGLQAALALLENAEEGEKIIYLISDLHRSEQRVSGSGGDPRWHLPRGVRVVPIPVASEVGENRAIVDVRVLSGAAQSGRGAPWRLLVRVGNFQSARARMGIRLSVNDRLVQEKAIELDPDAVATVEFADVPLDPGNNRVHLEADPDRLPEDDGFFLVLRRELPKPVLILEGSRARAPSERASFYVQQALLADEAFGPERVVVRTIAETREGNPVAEVAEAEAVVVVDPVALDARWATALRQFVTEGGGMILALGPQTEARAFNAAFGSWLVVLMEESVGFLREPALLAEIATEHPIFRPFADPRRANFSRVRFSGYAGLVLDATGGGAPSSAILVLARFSDGRPAIVEITRGRGKVILLAFGLDARWSTLPLTPLYAPLLHQMLGAVRRPSPPPFFRVGESIAVEGSEASVIVRAPDGERLRLDEEQVGGIWRFTPERVGFYHLRRLRGEEPIAVNVEAGESDVRPMEGAELDQLLASLGGRESRLRGRPTRSEDRVGTPSDPALNAGGGRATDAGVSQGDLVAAERSRAWRALLLAAMLLLLSEAILAERAPGRHPTRSEDRVGIPRRRRPIGASVQEEGRG